MSFCLQLDLGNSSAKWRLLQGNEIVARGLYQHGDSVGREALLASADAPEQIWISSVAGPDVEAELVACLQQQWQVQPWFARTPQRSLDLINSYAQPERMGVDRWLAMLAARHRCVDRLCLVDAGSALTIDLVAASGRHEGGYIIPGPALMERALLLDTDRVRFDENVDYSLRPGASTAEAVRHGIALAQAGAVSLALRQAADPVPALFFCGGAGETLMQLLGAGGLYLPDLVFEGLALMAGESGLPRLG